MTGNASEWVQDCHGDYRNAPSDGSAFGGPPCNGRVFRGGSYSAGVAAARVANRQYAEPDRRTSGIGFRLVRELTEE